jgi:hypothetical protein
LSSLKELAFEKSITSRPAEDSYIAGLVCGLDRTDVPLILKPKECQRIIDIYYHNNFRDGYIWKKYGINIKECASGERKYLAIKEFNRPLLYSFESRLQSATKKGILSVDIIPFGEVVVWGSGVSSDHNEQQMNTLGYCLFGVDPKDIDDSAIHLLRTHGWSERVIPIDTDFGFRTFGGGYLSCALIEPEGSPGMVEFRISKGEYFRDPEHTDLVCKVYEREGKLCVESMGKKIELKKFWEYDDSAFL